MENRRYVVSFGDSTRYLVSFSGTKEDFLYSDVLKDIKSKVSDYLKNEFPAGGYEAVAELHVADDDGRPYPELDPAHLGDLLHSVKRQVKVEETTDEINNNAPYDSL